MRKLQRFWSEFRDQPWIFQFGEGLVLALLAAALLLPGPAKAAERIARHGDDWVRVTDMPCTSEAVLARIESGAADQFRAAYARFQGKDYQACWRMVGNAAHLIYEDGDQGIVPAGAFKDVTTI